MRSCAHSAGAPRPSVTCIHSARAPLRAETLSQRRVLTCARSMASAHSARAPAHSLGSLAPSLTHSLARSLTHSLAHSLAHSVGLPLQRFCSLSRRPSVHRPVPSPAAADLDGLQLVHASWPIEDRGGGSALLSSARNGVVELASWPVPGLL